MIIEQTVDIPADRRVHLDFEKIHHAEEFR